MASTAQAKPSAESTLAELRLRNQELENRYVLEVQKYEEVCDDIDELTSTITEVRERLQTYCVMPEFKARNAKNRGFGAANVTNENRALVLRTVSVLESNAQTVTIRLNTVRGYNADLEVEIEMREKELEVNTAYEGRLAQELTVAQAERAAFTAESAEFTQKRVDALKALARMKDAFEIEEREAKETLVELQSKLNGGGKKVDKFGRGGPKKTKKEKKRAPVVHVPAALSKPAVSLSPGRIVQQRRMRRGRVAAAAAAAAERKAAAEAAAAVGGSPETAAQ
jgi:hypothetical protein